MKKKNKTLFNFLNRDKVKDAEAEDTSPTLLRYFKLLGRKFWRLISVNLMMLPMILPVLLVIYFYISSDTTPIENNPLFAQIYGANVIEQSPESTMLLDIFGAQLHVPVFENTATTVMIIIAAVFLIITFGWQNVGATYVLRNMVRGEPVFLFSDYFYAIKRNLKQGFFMGVIDLLAIFLLAFDYLYFGSQPSSFFNDFFYFAILLLAVLYFLMRLYIYLMLVTFELSIRKILKNALIFAVLGIKRNVMAILGLILITAVQVLLFMLFQMTPLGIALPLILMLLYYLGVTAFTCAYAAFPVIERFMIDPYLDELTEEKESSESEA